MLPVDPLYVLMFGSGLLGGFGHCIGMCGPVVAAYSLNLRQRDFTPHLLYNLGRITTYSLMGGFVGLTGTFAGVARSVERLQDIALAVVGAIMVLMGLSIGGWMPFLRRRRAAGGEGNSHTVLRLLSSSAAMTGKTDSRGACFPMGLVLGFLPCGLLYTALIGAAGAGMETGDHIKGFLRGMALLLVFGLGTVPAMLLLGKIVSLKGEWLRSRFCKGSAIMIILMGVSFVYRALA